MCGNACWFQSKWSHAEFILNTIHLLTCIFMTVFHGYSLHLWTLCARFHIHTRQTFCPPPSTFALLLVGRALQDRILQFQAQNGRHVSELSQGPRELHRPTNLLCIPSQNPQGWLNVNSTRGLGCFYIIHHIRSSPDVVISKGNLLWVIMLETDIKYASRITCIICCGCVSSKCSVSKFKKRGKMVLMRPNSVTGSDFKPELHTINKQHFPPP